jgi:hypothetical protein
MPEVKSKACFMLILGIFLDQKLLKYFLRKTHFDLPIFEFTAVFLNFPLGEGGGPLSRGTLLILHGVNSPFPLFFFLCLPHRGGFAPRRRLRVL